MIFVVHGTEADVYHFAHDLVHKALNQGIPERYVIEIDGKLPVAQTGGEISAFDTYFGGNPDA
jgi:hypothetical protein